MRCYRTRCTYLDATFNQETLEPLHTSFHKRQQVFLFNDEMSRHVLGVQKMSYLIAWYHASPERNVCETLILGGRPLHFQVINGHCRRNRIERHINDACDAA